MSLYCYVDYCFIHLYILYYISSLVSLQTFRKETYMIKSRIAISFQVLLLIAIAMANNSIEMIIITHKKEQIGYFN